MAQADLLVSLFRSGSNGDQLGFRRTAQALIEEERSKGHRVLATRLVKSLEPAVVPMNPLVVHKNNGTPSTHRDLAFEITPERTLDSLILADPIRHQLKEFVEEQHRSDLLHSHNLRARNRVLLAGPPGNGKTTLAEALASELMYPLLSARYDTLVGSFLGETSSRLRHLIEFAKTQRCVLFFDEFETLGKERGDTHETGEIKRVVSSLLLQIDELPDYVVIVAASNHPELLDRAVWRRFQLRLELPLPTRDQLANQVKGIAERCGINFGYTAETLAKHLIGQNFAEAEEFCLGIVRRAILDHQTDNALPITKQKLDEWRSRLKPKILKSPTGIEGKSA
ncbi:MAG: ATP-binding protein [Burkholderiales bacterium]|jgi:SpoVK/Ycf46/Vps4 family AAA+-type ATPase|nr:ATP-binding protein [Burkholderiales bacterium]